MLYNILYVQHVLLYNYHYCMRYNVDIIIVYDMVYYNIILL